jgi:hypothetical protein
VRNDFWLNYPDDGCGEKVSKKEDLELEREREKAR